MVVCLPRLCVVVMMLAQLTESLRRQIDDVFAEHIVLNDVEDYFKYDVVSAAIKALVRFL